MKPNILSNFAWTVAISLTAATVGLASDLPRVAISSLSDERCVRSEEGEEMKTFSALCDLGNGYSIEWSSTDDRDTIALLNDGGDTLYQSPITQSFLEILGPFSIYEDRYSDAWSLTYLSAEQGRPSLRAIRVEGDKACSIPVYDVPAYEAVRRLKKSCDSDFAFTEAPYFTDMSWEMLPLFVQFSDIAEHTCRWEETEETAFDNDEADLLGPEGNCIGIGPHSLTITSYDARDYVEVKWYGEIDRTRSAVPIMAWLIDKGYSSFMQASGTVEWIAESPFMNDEKSAPFAVIIPYRVSIQGHGDSTGQRPRIEFYQVQHITNGHLGFA
ncbi:MAG: hypothetical protein AAGG69_15085, partial [Pseudomonadota bacterium]